MKLHLAHALIDVCVLCQGLDFSRRQMVQTCITAFGIELCLGLGDFLLRKDCLRFDLLQQLLMNRVRGQRQTWGLGELHLLQSGIWNRHLRFDVYKRQVRETMMALVQQVAVKTCRSNRRSEQM